MRTLRLLLVVGALLASAGGAFAQTVTPVASQLLPCRAGGGPLNTCGGLCAVGSTCVWVQSGVTAACSCQVDALVCGVGTQAELGLCPGLPGTPDGSCTQRGAGSTGGAAGTGGTNYRCR